MRVAGHFTSDDSVVAGEDITTAPKPFVGNAHNLIAEAHAQRPELKSLLLNAKASRANATLMKAGRYPQVVAFGEATYANPNPRRIPQADEWFPTWSLGAQFSWSPNDVGAANAQGNEWDAKAATLEAQRRLVLDAIELEVTATFNALRESDTSIQMTRRQLLSATEAYRVARELFTNGRATSTTLTDAETELLRARLEALNSNIEAKMARAKIEHAVGRTARQFFVQDKK